MKTLNRNGLLIAWLLTIISFQAFSQKTKDKDKFKFGNVIPEELRNPAPEDSTAGAVVLFDIGKSYFITTATDVQLVFEYHKRIKINTKAGYDWANGSIGLRQQNTNREIIANFSAATYNFIDGKVVATKLEKDGIFDDKVIEYYQYKKFAMPDVKEGSIIEYKYRIYSPFIFNIRDWTFQATIPVRHSEYTFEIPDFFHFKKEMKGYEPVGTTMKNENRQFLGYNSTLEIHSMIAENLAAFRSEAYLTSAGNYITAIVFEIASVNPPWGAPIKIIDDWKTIQEGLSEDEEFGGILSKKNAIKDKVDSLTQIGKSEKDKMIAIYDYVRKNFKWNDETRIYASQKLKKTIDEKSGNCADINLLLTLMLKTAGLSSYPVILSTRDHGMILPYFAPILSKYNYTISSVTIEGKKYMLDATDKWRNYDVLPERCLNGVGRILYETASDWVDLKNSEALMEYNVLQFTLDNDGNLNGTVNASSKSYAAFVGRSGASRTSQDEYLKEVKKKRENWDIKKLEIQNLEKLEDAFIEKYDVIISNMASQAGDKIYLEPILFGKMIENPFKMETRNYPVDFAYPINKVYNCSIKLPEGYTLEEQVKPLLAMLPEKAGRFSFEITESNGSLLIRSNLLINKIVFLPDEYQSLKEFYNMIVTKHSEQIVLKKI